MGKEIERKFLVKDQSFREKAVGCKALVQGYISTNPDATVRVRIADDCGYLTLKSRNYGAERGEWEYQIPIEEARELITTMCGDRIITKTRYIVPHGGLIWEIDEFHGRLEGLVVAEVEVPSIHCNIAPLPSFIGAEVTGDKRYYNSILLDAVTPPISS